MDIEWDNPLNYVLTAVMYVFCMIVLWKFGDAMGAWPLKNKIVISIISLPLTFGAVAWQMSKR